MTDAVHPIRLSGPYSSKICVRSAVEPLPEIGRNKARGRTSGGNPKKEAAGAIHWVNKSKIPEAYNMVTAMSSPTKEGKMETEECNPSFAPSKNVSNTGTFLTIPNNKIRMITEGIM